MRFYLIRHGQSTWNQQNRIQGHSNPPLSAKGRGQVERLISRLKREKVEKIIASPLKRAHESAEILAKGLQIPFHTKRDLREIYLGTWEGKTPEEINHLYNNGYQKWLTTPSKTKIPKAEKISDFCKRAVRVFQEIVSSEKKERIAIVTHGGILSALTAHWLKADFDRVLLCVSFENSSLTIAEVFNGQVYLSDINSGYHLHAVQLPL